MTKTPGRKLPVRRSLPMSRKGADSAPSANAPCSRLSAPGFSPASVETDTLQKFAPPPRARPVQKQAASSKTGRDAVENSR